MSTSTETETRSAAEPPAGSAAPASSAGDPLLWVVLPLFLLSGAAGLIYEVVWTRLLIYVFGAGLYAVTAVLSAFMAGLALGSALIARRADTIRFPLRFYAMLELVIGSVAMFLPFLMQRTDGADAIVREFSGGSFALLTASRFVLTFALMLIPATLMGATLPILSRAVTRSGSSLGFRIGALYAVNTAGAVLGAFLTGFHLIARWGVLQTVFIGVVLNYIAALLAYLVSARTEAFGSMHLDSDTGRVSLEPAPSPNGAANPEPEAGAISAPAAANEHARLILIIALSTGALAMAAQVLWSRSLVFVFEFLKNTTYAFSAMLTIFLGGLALGGAAASPLTDRMREPVRTLGTVLVLLGLSVALSVNIIYWGGGAYLLPRPLAEGAQELNWPLAVLQVLGQSAFVIGVPTVLMGMVFPIAARVLARPGAVGSDVGRIYAINTVGAIVGPLIASFLIIPAIGLTGGLFLIAGLYAAAGLLTVWRAGSGMAAAGSLAVLAIGGLGLSAAAVPRDRGMAPPQPFERIIYNDEGPMATVSVAENRFGYRTIVIDGVGVAGTDPMLQTDQKSLAHLPMLLADNPKSALTVGFGSGGASYSYLLHDRLERLDCAEICPAVPQAAPLLTAANHGFLERNDPRYTIIYEDVRSYLRQTDIRYDVIATDCTDLRYKSGASLYDLEYFTFCRDALNPGGMVVVWMPLAGLSVEMFKIALRTFHRVFPEMGVFFMNNEPTHYVLLAGWRDEMRIDYAELASRLEEEDVRADLAEIHMADPAKLVSTWITGGGALAESLKGNAINTENRPLLEFLSPRYGYGDRPLADNLESLLAAGHTVLDVIAEGTITPEERARLERHESAAPHIIRGHGLYRDLDIDGATRAYMAAADLTPGDPGLRYLLNFRELTLIGTQGDPWGMMRLGRSFQIQGRADEAADLYRIALRVLGKPEEGFRRQMAEDMTAWLEELKDLRRGQLRATRESEGATE